MEKEVKEFQRVYAEIDMTTILDNFKSIERHLSGHAKVMPVIKADGYGHGAESIAHCLEKEEGVYGFCVSTAEEAFALRETGVTKPVLNLGYVFSCANEQMIKEDIRFTVFREDAIHAIDYTAQELGKKAKVHIKVDTGMNRIGIKPDDTGLQFIKTLTECKNIEIEGIFTHFSKADEADKAFTEVQIDTFLAFLHRINKELHLDIPMKHCCNSAGIIRFPEAHMDLVRAGIILYGIYPSDQVEKDILQIRPALSLCSHISYIKTVAPGEYIGYGGAYRTDAEKKVATIPVGYGDGYPRELSGKGYVIINGQKAPILGRICMDQFMVDVSHIDDVKVDDKVVLIGSQKGVEITVDDISQLSGRFNYEIICGLNKRVPRVFHR